MKNLQDEAKLELYNLDEVIKMMNSKRYRTMGIEKVLPE